MVKEKGKEHLVHREFTLPDGYSVKYVVMRELDGLDEREAAKLISALGTADSVDIALMEANIARSIVAIDGEEISQPYLGLTTMTLKTRRLLMAAFHELNGIPDEDIISFLGAKTTPDEASEKGVLETAHGQ